MFSIHSLKLNTEFIIRRESYAPKEVNIEDKTILKIWKTNNGFLLFYKDFIIRLPIKMTSVTKPFST